MAYRVECKKTVKEAFDNLVDFLTKPVSFEVNYDLSQGNGNIENISFNLDTVQTETWELKYDATNDLFKVTGSVSGAQDDAYLDQPYNNGIISFIIRQGEVAWQDGDIVIIDVKTSSAENCELVNYGWYQDDPKAWIVGDYGYSVNSWENIYQKRKIKVNKNNFTAICNGYYNSYYYNSSDFYYVGLGGGYKVQYNMYYYISCDSITDVSHKLSSNVSILVRCSLLGYNRRTNIRNVLKIFNYVSDYFSSETTVDIHFDFNTKQIVVMGENVYDFSDYFFELKNEEEIVRNIIFNFDNVNGYLSIYIDGVKVVDNLQNDKWKNFTGLFGKIVEYPYFIDGYYVYNRLLSDEEIQSIENNGGHPSNDLRDFYISILNNTSWKPYAILKHPKNGYIKLIDRNIYWQPVINHRLTKDWVAENTYSNETIQFKPYNTPFIGEIPKISWGDYEEVLDKYWFVWDGKDLLIALKHYDPTRKEDPVYNIYYLGWGIGHKTYNLPFYIGMIRYDKNYNWWETTNTDYRFGLLFNDTKAAWNGQYWDSDWLNDGTLNGSWQSIKTDNKQISIIQCNLYKDFGSGRIINYGTPKFLYAVNFGGIEPETEVYVDGVKHIVIPDNLDVVEYKYLIGLEE